MQYIFDATIIADYCGVIINFQYLDLLIQSLTEIENTQRVFQEYAAKADFDRFNAILARVPDVEPLPRDELP